LIGELYPAKEEEPPVFRWFLFFQGKGSFPAVEMGKTAKKDCFYPEYHIDK
jgi:hypothetical protein